MTSKREIVFVLPAFSMPSNRVRALCLAGFEPQGWTFTFYSKQCPALFNFRYLRDAYKLVHYFCLVLKKRFLEDVRAFYFIKPSTPGFFWFIRKAFGCFVIADVNDPYHLPELFGERMTRRLLNNVDHVVFESPEYSEYWSKRLSTPSSVVEDTPQHESVYLDYSSRKRAVVWIGSFHTARFLAGFRDYFRLFHERGYRIILLGCDPGTAAAFTKSGIPVAFQTSYSVSELETTLSSCQLAFVPMDDAPLFTLRGNLKAKLCMSYGCLTIASDLPMHRRLIHHGSTGFLFRTIGDLHGVLNLESSFRAVALLGNRDVADNNSRSKHANAIADIVSTELS